MGKHSLKTILHDEYDTLKAKAELLDEFTANLDEFARKPIQPLAFEILAVNELNRVLSRIKEIESND